jgi:hypothetical protein
MNDNILKCPICGIITPDEELNAYDMCSVCAALYKLRNTMEKRGRFHPDLFESHRGERQLPPSDRKE